MKLDQLNLSVLPQKELEALLGLIPLVKELKRKVELLQVDSDPLFTRKEAACYCSMSTRTFDKKDFPKTILSDGETVRYKKSDLVCPPIIVPQKVEVSKRTKRGMGKIR